MAESKTPNYEEIAAQLNAGSKGHLPGLVGCHVTGAGKGWLCDGIARAPGPDGAQWLSPRGDRHRARRQRLRLWLRREPA